MKRLKTLHLVIGLVLLSSAFVKSDEFDEDDGITVENEAPETVQDENAPDTLDYQSPYADPSKFYFADHFDDPEQFKTKWVKSAAKKDDIAEEIAKYDGVFDVEAPQRTILKNDLGLVLKTKAKHAAISSRLSKPFVFTDKPLVVQYEVTMQEGQDCGGSYIKLLSSGPETTDLSQFRDKTPYTIMFGPDKCGNDIKLHFIFRHVNPINGTITEKHCRKPKERLEEPFKDKQPHLYTLIIRPDNTYSIKFDNNVVNDGSLFTEFTPPVNPPKEIDDPNDKKPENWDEREKIPDPDARKPNDWNEDSPPQIPDASVSKPEGWLDDVEEMIPDPNAEKPDDWDVEMDGEWEAPLIANPICEKAVGCGLWKAPLVPNPDYKGKWRAPLIDNPNYQGKWAPRKIPNPDFFEDLHPFKMTTISAVGLELWSMSSDLLFDNMVITDDEAAAYDWAQQTFDLKRRVIDKQAETFVSKVAKYTNENPWIWAVIIVVVGLPLSIVLYLACSSPKAKPSDEAGKRKKTDEYDADDQVAEEAVKAPGKSGLNEPPMAEEQEDVDNKEESNEEEEVEEEINEDDEAENDQEESEGAVVEEIVDDEPESTQETATRKRKPRRE